MRLTVLGKSPAWTDAGGACSGYLVEEGGTRILIDCGNGVFGKLRAISDEWAEIDAVVISHVHADHVLDLYPFAYALTFSVSRRPPGSAAHGPRLAAPPGALARLRRIAGGWGPEELVERAFAASEYEPRSALTVGPIELRFAEVPHYTLTFAIDVRSSSGGRFTYGADCAPSPALVGLADQTPLLVAEATLPAPDPDPSRPPGHMTAAEAGALAAEAGAGRLLLTHISDERDLEQAAREAAGRFGGAVEVAREGMEIEL